MIRAVVTAKSFCEHPGLVRTLKDSLEAQGGEMILSPGGSVATEAALTDATIWLIGRERFVLEDLQRLPNLRLIAKYGVGLDNFDFTPEEAESRGLCLAWEPGVNAWPVAEHTLGMILSLLRNLRRTSRDMEHGKWNKNGGLGLRGRTLTVVGCGHVGTRVCELGRVFDANLVIVDIVDKSANSFQAKQMTLKEALPRTDILSLHVPLTSQTRSMIGPKELALLPPHALVINTARGEILDLQALKGSLLAQKLGGAGLDVYPHEPYFDEELFALPNVIATPHTAGNSDEAVLAMGQAAIKAIDAFLKRLRT